MRRTDRRFIKTEKTLLKALSNLTKEKDFDLITIGDLIYEADINKSTFYLHYQSIDQFISALEDDFISEISSSLYTLQDNLSAEVFFRTVMESCLKNKEVCFVLLNSFNSRFNGKIENFFKKFLRPLKIGKRNKINDENSFLVSSIIQAEMGVLRTWILDGCRFDREVLIRQCVSIAQSNAYEAVLLK